MPRPNTIGGGTMGYPTTVDTGLPTPIALFSDDIASLVSTITIVAGSAYYVAVTLYAPITIAQMRTDFSGSPTGQIDMGIYDATAANNLPGNLLGHTGQNAAATGVFTKSLTANLMLSPGLYWLALVDTVADTVLGRAFANTSAGVAVKTSATNLTTLTSTGGTVANTANKLLMIGLASGSWS